MSQTVYIPIFDEDVDIEQPDLEDSWVNALEPLVKGFLEDVYYEEYNCFLELDDAEDQKMIASSLIEAIERMRASGSDDKEKWKDILIEHLTEAISKYRNDVEDALLEKDWYNLLEELDEAMSKIEGPTCDYEGVFQRLTDMAVDNLYEKDTSSVMDVFRRNRILLHYIPGLRNKNEENSIKGIDPRFAINHYMDDAFLESNATDQLDPNWKNFIKLFNIPAHQVFDEAAIDYSDVEAVKKYDQLNQVPVSGEPIMPIEAIRQIKENFHSGVPVWAGEIKISDLFELDVTKPLCFKGGVAGIHDFFNGSGHVDIVEGTITIDPDENFTLSGKYGIQSTYDLVRRTLQAELPKEKVKNQLPPNGFDNEPSI